MNLEPMEYYLRISDYFEEEEQNELHDMFDSIKFKLNRNDYHFENIKKIITQSKDLDRNDYYKDINLPIYYEIECFLTSLRSTVDMLLHLINFSYKMNLKQTEVNLYNVYHNRSLSKNTKNIFDRYTRPYNNPTWNFIYTFRNEIVHEKSIHQVLPVRIDLFSSEEPIVLFILGDTEKELVSFFNTCLRFLDNFASLIFQSIEISLNKNE